MSPSSVKIHNFHYNALNTIPVNPSHCNPEGLPTMRSRMPRNSPSLPGNQKPSLLPLLPPQNLFFLGGSLYSLGWLQEHIKREIEKESNKVIPSGCPGRLPTATIVYSVKEVKKSIFIT